MHLPACFFSDARQKYHQSGATQPESIRVWDYSIFFSEGKKNQLWLQPQQATDFFGRREDRFYDVPLQTVMVTLDIHRTAKWVVLFILEKFFLLRGGLLRANTNTWPLSMFCPCTSLPSNALCTSVWHMAQNANAYKEKLPSFQYLKGREFFWI